MRKLSGAASLAAATAVLAIAVPGGISAAQVITPQPNLKTLVAEAKVLETQINSLSEQYDGLRIQLNRAKANSKIAQQAASRGQAALAIGQQAIAQLAAANYINSGLDPTFAALTTGDPSQFLSQASAIAEMNQSSGVKVSTLSNKVTQALRDKETADQQAAAVRALETQMDAKKKIIEAKIDKVNSAAMKQAMAVFKQTGSGPEHQYPDREHHRRPGPAGGTEPPRRSDNAPGRGLPEPVRLLRPGGAGVRPAGHRAAALHRQPGGIPAACTWPGCPEPGDLVFFGADISHVGIYVRRLQSDARRQPYFGPAGPGPAESSPRTSARVRIA